MAWEVLARRDGRARQEARVTIRPSGLIALNGEAMRALGEPQRVEVLYDASARLAGFRPTADPGGCTVRRVSGGGVVHFAALLRCAGLRRGRSYPLTATFDAGMLVVQMPSATPGSEP